MTMLPSDVASKLADALEGSWRAKARPNQLPPPGDWLVWMLLAGRGFGKTRVLSEMANSWATSGQCRRLAIVAATAADARDVMAEGESGILETAPSVVPADLPIDTPANSMAKRLHCDAVFRRRTRQIAGSSA